MTTPTVKEVLETYKQYGINGLTLDEGKVLISAAQEADRYREALEYMADERNWEVSKEDNSCYMLRPGGGYHAGIILVSRILCPWVFAHSALSGEKERK